MTLAGAGLSGWAWLRVSFAWGLGIVHHAVDIAPLKLAFFENHITYSYMNIYPYSRVYINTNSIYN